MGSGFRVQGSGFRVLGYGFRVQGSGFWVQGSGFWVQGSGFKGFNILIFATLYSIVWIDRFHPLGVTALQALRMRNPLKMHPSGLFNREP
jgi:hypothetical protein